MIDGILNGIRVLDFTWVLAGPYATRLLADFGAEVIKVQSAKTARGAEANLSGYFSAWNRNKRSITLDLGRPEARELALRLIKISDVVVENFSPRVKTNWGFDYDRLREMNPRLVMASLSGMGQTGPWRDRRRLRTDGPGPFGADRPLFVRAGGADRPGLRLCGSGRRPLRGARHSGRPGKSRQDGPGALHRSVGIRGGLFAGRPGAASGPVRSRRGRPAGEPLPGPPRGPLRLLSMRGTGPVVCDRGLR